MTIAALSSGSEETAPRKTGENTVKHCNGSVGSVVANHRGGGESAVVVTTVAVTNIDDRWVGAVADGIFGESAHNWY